jgi:hypothetical protein
LHQVSSGPCVSLSLSLLVHPLAWQSTWLSS